MEDLDDLLRRILAWAETDSRVEAVVETGSRARRQSVDALSDLDIELIGAQPSELADDDAWIQELGNVMVTQALANDSPGDLGWPTRLVVFDQGNKVRLHPVVGGATNGAGSCDSRSVLSRCTTSTWCAKTCGSSSFARTPCTRAC